MVDPCADERILFLGSAKRDGNLCCQGFHLGPIDEAIVSFSLADELSNPKWSGSDPDWREMNAAQVHCTVSVNDIDNAPLMQARLLGGMPSFAWAVSLLETKCTPN